MGFVSLRLYGFRNIVDGRIECDAPEVFLIGDNGQGKTNLIEAVHLLCYGSSFRSRVDARMVCHGRDRAGVEGRLRLPGGPEIDVEVRFGTDKEILLDGKVVHDRAELLNNVPCIVFCHEDFDFVTGSPERRRWFLNQTLSLTDLGYLPALRRYRRLLGARNVLVRSGNHDLLEEYDAQVASVGFDLQTRRAAAMAEFGLVFSSLFEPVARFEFPVSLRYAPSWRQAESAGDAERILRSRRDVDLRLGTTTSGPHRDSYTFLTDDRPLDNVGSTGQLRLCALMLRVAQACYFRDRTGRLPILLLDDVILELDTSRKQAFMENLPARDQAFFTFLSDESYGGWRTGRSLSYRVTAGKLEPCSA